METIEEPTDYDEPSDSIPPPSITALRRGLLTGPEIRAWRNPDPWRIATDLSLIWLQALGGLALFLVYPGALTYITAFLLIGGAQHGMSLVMHEASHYSIVPRNRKLNDWIGAYLFSLPVGIPLPLYRHRHFVHHRMYSTESDPKTSYKRDVRGYRLMNEILRSISGLEYVTHALAVFARDREDAEQGESAPRAHEILMPLIVVQIIIFGLFCLVNPWLYLTLWLAPNVSAHNLFDKLRALMEHQPLPDITGVDPDGPYYRGTEGPFVRSVNASLLERLFISKINFGFHAEHHVWPSLSYQYLPLARERLVAANVFDDPRFAIEKTFLSSVAKMWRA